MNLKDLTPEQLKVYQALQRIKMAWVVLIAMLVVFVSLTIVVVWIAMSEHPGVAVVLGIVDGIVGWAIKHIVSFLFPHEPTPISN